MDTGQVKNKTREEDIGSVTLLILEMVVSYYSMFLSSVPVFRSSFHPFGVFHLLYHSFIVFGVWSIYFGLRGISWGAPHIFLGIPIPVSYPIP